MKKYLVLASMFFVSACAQGPIVGEEDCTYHTEKKAEEVQPQPAPTVVHQPAPVIVQQVSPCAQRPMPAPVVVQQPVPCNGCQPTVSATREPVEIVYKKTTYTTVYEPKTTSDITYEKEAIKGAPVQTIAPQPIAVAPQPITVTTQPVTVAAQPVEVVVQRPAAKEIVVQQPTVSRVIEKQITQEPVKISVEEVK